jgi:hypothetical protein
MRRRTRVPPAERRSVRRKDHTVMKPYPLEELSAAAAKQQIM